MRAGVVRPPRRPRAGRPPRRGAALAALAAAGALAGAGCAGRRGAPAAPAAPAGAPDAREWVQLFNGRDLDGWTPKFKGSDLGVNFRDTFRVDGGMLRVRYDRWPTFDGEFGHLFYRRPYSHYVVAVEYRFVGEQVAGAGPSNAWAVRNNGIMVASQSPGSMGTEQNFPVSLEVQLLGGLGNGRPRTTGNLCTPGTHVYLDGKLHTPHCTNSTSRTYEGDRWVRVEAMVLGDSVVKHIVEGDTVLTYTRPVMGGGSASGLRPGVMQEGRPLADGYIALQAETAPIDFRKVELLDLSGCADPKATNYKRYVVKAIAAACRYATATRP